MENSLVTQSLVLATILPCILAADDGHSGFSYDPNSELGPTHWPGECTVGKRQSPIAFWREDTVIDKCLAKNPPRLVSYFLPLSNCSVTNTGTTVKIDIDPVFHQRLSISGANLKDVYYFKTFHFHWSVDNSGGSEHIFGNVGRPLEMHILHFPKEGSDDATVVALSVSFVVSRAENTELNKVLQVFEAVKFKGGNEMLVDDIIMENFISRRDAFYRYQGSVTTPDCLEVVEWIVLEEPQNISQTQLDQFRRLLSTSENESAAKPIGYNFRPVQQLNGRRVYVPTSEVLLRMQRKSGQPITKSSVFMVSLAILFRRF